MNIKLANASIPLLRWTLGLVVVLESVEFILSNSAAHFLAKAELPSWNPARSGRLGDSRSGFIPRALYS